MAKVKLDDKVIKRAAPPAGQIELWDKTLPGFAVRISLGGTRTYVVMARIGGKLVRRVVGKAPGPGAIPGDELPEGYYWAAEARQRARAVLIEMERGHDPVGRVRQPKPKRAARPEAGTATAEGDHEAAPGTVRYVAEKYLRSTLKGGGGRLRSKAELERKLKVDLSPWHDRPIASITKRDIRELIDGKAEKSPVAANRLLSFVKRLFAWAAEKDFIEADPARAVRKPADEAPRTRYLDEREIALFWKACSKLDDPPEGEPPAAEGSVGRLFQFALLTGQRRGEVAGLRRSELGKLSYKTTDPKTGKPSISEADAWLLPAERTKRGADHSVPLSPLALSIIEMVPKRARPDGVEFEHVFASGAAGDQPVSGWAKYKRRLDELIGHEIAKEAGEEYDPAKHKLEPWHVHDLRATAATFLETRLGVAPQVVSRILNHAEGDRGRSMTARYVRHTWDAEAAEALKLWAGLVQRIVGLNIVELPSRSHSNS